MEIKKLISKETITIVLIAFCILLMINKGCDHNTINNQLGLIESINDTVKTWKDKDNLNHARIQVIQTQRAKDFLVIQSKDAEIQKLQEVVEQYKKQIKNGGSVTNVTNTTGVNASSNTIILPGDTIYKNDSIFIYPEYNSHFNLEEWVEGNIIATRDSIQIDLIVKNDLSVIIGSESQGLFKPRKPFVEVVSYNPYTQTEKLRTFQTSPPRNKRFGIGPSINVGVDIKGDIHYTLGVSLQYSLIKF